jgi:hypothetical protein
MRTLGRGDLLPLPKRRETY